MKLDACITSIVLPLVLVQGKTFSEDTAVAVLDFRVPDRAPLGPDAGGLLADLVAAELSSREHIQVVDRAFLGSLFDEESLGLAGLTDERKRRLAGRILGARVLVKGRVVSFHGKVIITASMVRTDTGTVRAVVEETRGQQGLRRIATSLAEKIADALREETSASSTKKPTDTTAAKGPRLQARKVLIHIAETLPGTSSPSSAAADELGYQLMSRGVSAYEPKDAFFDWLERREATLAASWPRELDHIDLVILGEASTQVGLRTGELISAEAKLEISAVRPQTREVLFSHRAQRKAVNVTPTLAARDALQAAARESASRLNLHLPAGDENR